jgi:MFS family permease
MPESGLSAALQTMLSSALQVRSLLAAIFILMAGSGFLSTLIGLRLERAGSGTMAIGMVATAYFAGLAVGALRAQRIVYRVGHIRAFAAFVSLLSASTLTYALVDNPVLWTGLRFIDGLCVAGVFICLESWLNARADAQTRGSILANYMIALYSGQAVGQLLLNLGSDKAVPFLIASILISIAILPVVLTRIEAPPLHESESISLRSLFHSSPLGVIGAVTTGLMLGAFYGLAAVHVRRLGLDLSQTSTFMSVVILGGVLLQWPLGRLSDQFDRRAVIVVCFAAAMAASLALAMTTTPGIALLIFGGLFGGLSFTLYPLCVAHTNDRLHPSCRVAASGRLILLYSVGAALGPIGAAGFITLAGSTGLFLFIGACAGSTLVFGLWRQQSTLPVPGALQQLYQILPRTTPVAAMLDPNGPEQTDA